MPTHPQADALLVALGAIPGAWLRFRVVEHLSPILPRRHWATLGVNLAACFSLGLLVPLVGPATDRPAQALLLLLAAGFCGSLSTFSTWVAELWQDLQNGRWGGALRLGLLSLGLGLGAMALGLQIGRLTMTTP
ncbi:MAG: FluC/FEX family fluoride channel [Cyanobacteriota bacterium]